MQSKFSRRRKLAPRPSDLLPPLPSPSAPLPFLTVRVDTTHATAQLAHKAKVRGATTSDRRRARSRFKGTRQRHFRTTRLTYNSERPEDATRPVSGFEIHRIVQVGDLPKGAETRLKKSTQRPYGTIETRDGLQNRTVQGGDRPEKQTRGSEKFTQWGHPGSVIGRNRCIVYARPLLPNKRRSDVTKKTTSKKTDLPRNPSCH